VEEDSQVTPLDILAEAGIETEPESLEDFPSQVREDVEGLMWLGYLEDEFDFCGHHFVIRTLRGDEELLAALVTKEYIETMGQARAWEWAIVAMALISVDWDEAFCPPVGRDPRSYARARFHYCTNKWFYPLANFLYKQYAKLLVRQKDAMEAMEDLSQGSLSMFTPSPGSLTDRADSDPQEAEQQEDIRDFLDPQDSTTSNEDSSPS
jgi:hypothetical protein